MRKAFLFSFIVFSFVSCKEKYLPLGECDVRAQNNTRSNSDTVIYDEAEKKYYSRLTMPNTTGLQLSCTIPESKEDQELYLVFEGLARTNYANSNSGIALLGLNHKGEQLCWRFLLLRHFYTDLNKWCYFKDSIHLKTNHQWKNYVKFAAMANLTNSPTEVFDVQQIKLTVKKVE